MKKTVLNLTSETLLEIKNSCASLKNCTVIKADICIALQRNFKLIKAKLDELQEDLDLLKTNLDEALKDSAADKAELARNYRKDSEGVIRKAIEIELFTFTIDEFPPASSLGSKEVMLQNPQTGQTSTTTFNYIEAFLPLIDVLIFE